MSANTERLERMAAEAVQRSAHQRLESCELHCSVPANYRRLAAENDELAAFLRSLIPLVEAGERAQWQPIETAPKDGTKVLLYKPDDEFWCSSIATARWWAKESEWLCTGSAYFPAPTHWQPLPPEPKGGAE